ncbi:MAG: ABATE domain-containing protein [Acidobacteriia bacterium]|nr:ABATE domain-containing protein [Terriglobia bacterium]
MNTHSIRRRAPRFELNGDALCIDFVNTLDDRPSEQPKELLNSYIDLARFAEDTGILELSHVDELMKRSQMDPEGAQRVLRAAIELREAMYAIFHAIMKKETVPTMALAQLNACAQDAAQHVRLVATNRHFEWRFDYSSSFDAILWPIARSAADLLASDQLKFVRACGSKTCQWLFLDTSKNHRRRWCDMDVCGNRAKARRFYARKKKR